MKLAGGLALLGVALLEVVLIDLATWHVVLGVNGGLLLWIALMVGIAKAEL